MTIPKLPPFTIFLAGSKVLVDDADFVASAAITPGMLVELFDDTGSPKWRAHATASEQVSTAVALERDELNKTIDDDYAVDDVVKVGFLAPGSVFYGILPSGEDIAAGDLLSSNGDGKLQAATATTATANVAKFQAIDSPGAVLVDTRVRAQVIQ